MIYIIIFNSLKSKLEEIPALKSVDWFNSQYTNTEKEHAEAYPAGYIEILDPIVWKDASNKMQTGTCRFMLHLVLNNLKTEPNAILLLAQDVFLKFQGVRLMQGQNQVSGELSRYHTEMPKRYRQLKVMKIGFEAEVFDISAIAVETGVQAGFSVNTHF